MAAATFWADHTPSDSRALVEFILQDKKLKLTVFFVRGNVVDINAVRRCRQTAKELLIW